MATVTGLMTADELLLLPRGAWRYELLRGELRRISPSGHTHGKVAARVTVKMGPYVEENQLGEVYAAKTGFKIRQDPDTVRAPDIAFVSAQRLQRTMLSPRATSLVRRIWQLRSFLRATRTAMSKAKSRNGSSPA